MSLSRVAAWMTVVTTPITLITTIAGWFGKLPSIPSYHGSLTSFAFALALVTLIWITFFMGQLRFGLSIMNKFDGPIGLLGFILSGLFGLAIFVAAECFVLDAVFYGLLTSLALALWLMIPTALWIFAALVALMSVSGTSS